MTIMSNLVTFYKKRSLPKCCSSLLKSHMENRRQGKNNWSLMDHVDYLALTQHRLTRLKILNNYWKQSCQITFTQKHWLHIFNVILLS